jgi:sulfur carrier protein ThiS
MKIISISLKLYASLTEFFPNTVKNNRLELEVGLGTTVSDVLSSFQIPVERAHLVLINGVYILPNDRSKKCLSENDVLAIWPPVAGG